MSDEENTPGEEASHDVQDRMARRLRTDASETQPTANEGDSHADTDRNATANRTETATADAQREMDTMSAESKQSEMNAWNTANIRNAWTGVTVYLPEHLNERFNDEYRRIEFELGGDLPTGNSFQKDRHFKPLIIALGIEQLSRMEKNELNEHIERMLEHELPQER